MDHLDKARRVISLEIEELTRHVDRIDDSFVSAVEMLKTTVSEGAKILIVGVGKSGNIGSKRAATLGSQFTPHPTSRPHNPANAPSLSIKSPGSP